jgi:hypothetical protein
MRRYLVVILACMADASSIQHDINVATTVSSPRVVRVVQQPQITHLRAVPVIVGSQQLQSSGMVNVAYASHCHHYSHQIGCDHHHRQLEDESTKYQRQIWKEPSIWGDLSLYLVVFICIGGVGVGLYYMS